MKPATGRRPNPGAAAAGPLTALLAALLATVLVLCALALVTSQYRARQLFAELEVAQQEAKTLTTEGSRLRAELGRAAQPATVEAVARRLGMRAIDPDRVVILPAAAGAAGADRIVVGSTGNSAPLAAAAGPAGAQP